MYELFIVLYLLVALALIVLVLIQHGKGADMGASFGAGGSATIFGSSGTGNFLTRTTTVLATLFFALSLLLGNLSTDRVKAVDEWQDLSVPVDAKAVDAVEEKKPASDIPVGN
ncbi:preprotein translocase subunit SecG [Rheinheimera sediminis]|uniref:preprotein translocase subunit SecG n=1 Tax=Rheinheimera sp. YQF-1 TaxID=2499626 RepID=UPI000FD72201|nr:preprotein translocase subunit SecG [Rheinheimera sp. YQF-1]RVT42795.1 preprotein translocase subunit SecG [Rheinheimera sp. YQF-1]